MSAIHLNRYLVQHWARSTAMKESSVFCRRYGICLSVFALAYVLLFRSAVPTFIDEAYTYNVASDRSLGHMLSAIRNGADGSFPLYALMIWCWEKVFGASEASLRLNSGLFVVLFAWQSSKRIGKHFGSAVGALAILFAFADAIFTQCAVQARFYGLLVFLFSLCFWRTWDLIQGTIDSTARWLGHALVCGLLCLSHPLGLVYTGILAALYLIFSGFLKRFSLFNALTFLGGPALFLTWLPSFLRQRLVNPVYNGRALVPGLTKYWQFAFFDDMVLFLTCVAGILLIIAAHWFLKSKKADPTQDSEGSGPNIAASRSSRKVLLLYSIAFIVCLNGAVALLDAARVIPVYGMAAIRYVLVCWVPYAVIVAAILVRASNMLRRMCMSNWNLTNERIEFLAALAGLLALIALHWGQSLRFRASERAYFEKVSRIAREKQLPVVCENNRDAFYLATRTSTDRIAYLVEEDFPFARFLLQVSKYYPRPSPIYPASSLHYTNDYLYLVYWPKEAKIVNPTRK